MSKPNTLAAIIADHEQRMNAEGRITGRWLRFRAEALVKSLARFTPGKLIVGNGAWSFQGSSLLADGTREKFNFLLELPYSPDFTATPEERQAMAELADLLDYVLREPGVPCFDLPDFGA